MQVVLRLVAAASGVLLVTGTLGSALRTVVLPRGVPARISAGVFRVLRGLFWLRAGWGASYERRDAVMAAYGPVSLFALLAVWLVLVLVGYALVFLAADWTRYAGHPGGALQVSGSSLLTLGFDRPAGLGEALLAVSEAAVGVTLAALLVSYLPTVYARFATREAAVTKLEVRAGAPPRGVTMLVRAAALGRLDLLGEVWRSWEDWFVDVEEGHTAIPGLAFFRSPVPDKSWVTAAGAVLDAAALRAAVVDAPRDVDAELCIRAGYLSLRRVAGFFGLAYPVDPAPADPITVSRPEFDAAVAELAAAGLPVRADRDAAWRDFAGWRVNYDVPLVALAGLTLAPYAPWSSDRSLARRPGRRLRHPLRYRRRGGGPGPTGKGPPVPFGP